MTRFDPNHETLALSTLKDKVVVLTGGSSGIGAATVKLLLSIGSKVVFGDINPPSPELLEAIYIKTDVRVYADNLRLFKHALKKYGRVDHAIANAGALERKGGWFDPSTGIKGVENEPDLTTVDVNLKGEMYFAHIACSYLAHGNELSPVEQGRRSEGEQKLQTATAKAYDEGRKPPSREERDEMLLGNGQGGKWRDDKSLVLLSSVAGFKETPGLFTYEPSKAGVLGLMRALRLVTPSSFGVRVNAICPSMTTTQMTAGIKENWVADDLPTNTPEDVAKVIVALCAASRGSEPIWYDGVEGQGTRRRKNGVGGMDWDNNMDRGVNGRAIFVMGGEAYDVEEGLDRTQDLWLGKKISETLERGQRNLGMGARWS